MCCQCKQEVTETCIQWHPISSLQMMSHYDVEGMLATCNLHSAAKQECEHHDAVNRIEIHLKTQHRTISASRFVAEHIIEASSVCVVASKE